MIPPVTCIPRLFHTTTGYTHSLLSLLIFAFISLVVFLLTFSTGFIHPFLSRLFFCFLLLFKKFMLSCWSLFDVFSYFLFFFSASRGSADDEAENTFTLSFVLGLVTVETAFFLFNIAVFRLRRQNGSVHSTRRPILLTVLQTHLFSPYTETFAKRPSSSQAWMKTNFFVSLFVSVFFLSHGQFSKY
ncbi:unnamed protein product [Acanthosepion pharaonis]|uniref:Uncharacterized protein n=1 Tax=Acanthosepion pharaonis TaxID=158019 RepID=A0A812CZJ7_ACAPH|nr:unnamed protein product [Sepia pharaonis]